MKKKGSRAMSSGSGRRASSSESDPIHVVDQKKRKRMISNRESARRSRARKQEHLDSLITRAAQLETENKQMAMQINLISQQYTLVELENIVLRTQVMELTERLKSTSSVLRFVEDYSELTIDEPEIPNPVMQPWQQLQCPWPGFFAPSNVLQC